MCGVTCAECNKGTASVVVNYTHFCVYMPCFQLDNVCFKWRSFGSLDDNDKRTIREAADVIAKHTCVRFVKRTNQKDYIEFYEDSK